AVRPLEIAEPQRGEPRERPPLQLELLDEQPELRPGVATALHLCAVKQGVECRSDRGPMTRARRLEPLTGVSPGEAEPARERDDLFRIRRHPMRLALVDDLQ